VDYLLKAEHGDVHSFALLHPEVLNLSLFSIARLNKLETFKKIVMEELASLEKDTQILRNMEKDAVVCSTPLVPSPRVPLPN